MQKYNPVIVGIMYDIRPEMEESEDGICYLVSTVDAAMEEKVREIAKLTQWYETSRRNSRMCLEQISALQMYKDATLGKESERERQIVSLTSDNEILRNMNKILGESVTKLGEEWDRLNERDGKASLELCVGKGEYPFHRISLSVVDFGVADNCYVVASGEIDGVFKERDKLKAELAACQRELDRAKEK